MAASILLTFAVVLATWLLVMTKGMIVLWFLGFGLLACIFHFFYRRSSDSGIDAVSNASGVIDPDGVNGRVDGQSVEGNHVKEIMALSRIADSLPCQLDRLDTLNDSLHEHYSIERPRFLPYPYQVELFDISATRLDGDILAYANRIDCEPWERFHNQQLFYMSLSSLSSGSLDFKILHHDTFLGREKARQLEELRFFRPDVERNASSLDYPEVDELVSFIAKQSEESERGHT